MFGILDAIGGAGGSGLGNSNTSSTGSNVLLQDFAKLSQGQSALEASTFKGMQSDYSALGSLTNAGPGQQEISNALTGAYGYQGLLQNFVNNNGLPNTAQQQAGQQFAASMFQPQQTALQQSFIQQNQQNSRLEAALGRSSMDPVLQAKLGISQTQQQAQLNAQQGALASQTAMNMPQQQMAMANQLYGVQQNLASQAFANRQALLQMGNQLNNSERSYRLSSAGKTATTSQSGYQQTGAGGFQGVVGGLQAGMGTDFSMLGSLTKLMGGA